MLPSISLHIHQNSWVKPELVVVFFTAVRPEEIPAEREPRAAPSVPGPYPAGDSVYDRAQLRQKRGEPPQLPLLGPGHQHSCTRYAQRKTHAW